MKKYNVVSTRKNPDKYIEALKNQLAEAWDSSQQYYDIWNKERGKYITRYKDGVTSGISETSLEKARKFRVGDSVVVEGTVYEIKKQGKGYCVYWTLEEVRIKEKT